MGRPVARSPVRTSTSAATWVAAALTILALSGLRLVHLGADTPSSASPTGFGLYVDEGYKTESARRLARFGTSTPAPHDRFAGWMRESPLTQWSFYAGFRLFGTRVESARVVTVAYFAVFLAGYAWAFRRRYRDALFWAGLAALGLESTLFFFSRTALFEIPLTTCVYLFVFAIARARTPRPLVVTASVLVLGAIPIFGIKQSAAIYLAPLAVAPIAFMVLQRSRGRRIWPALVGVGLGVTVVLWATYGIWRPRLQIEPFEILGRVLFNPTVDVSTFVMLGGLACAVHGLLTRPDLYLRDLYRLCLIATIALTPLVFALFVYHPLRYYVPILPAYVLIALEWAHLRGWREPLPERMRPLVAGAFVAVSALWVFYASSAVNRLVLARWSLDLGQLPGISETAVRILMPLAVALAVLLFARRRDAFRPNRVAFAACALAAGFALQSSAALVSFFAAPTYRADAIRRDLARIVPEGQTIAGDWAPFFALGTHIESYYIHRRENPASEIESLGPNYFLYSPTYEGDVALREIETLPGVRLGEPSYQSDYNGKTVVLYPIVYTLAPTSHDATTRTARARETSG